MASFDDSGGSATCRYGAAAGAAVSSGDGVPVHAVISDLGRDVAAIAAPPFLLQARAAGTARRQAWPTGKLHASPTLS